MVAFLSYSVELWWHERQCCDCLSAVSSEHRSGCDYYNMVIATWRSMGLICGGKNKVWPFIYVWSPREVMCKKIILIAERETRDKNNCILLFCPIENSMNNWQIIDHRSSFSASKKSVSSISWTVFFQKMSMWCFGAGGWKLRGTSLRRTGAMEAAEMSRELRSTQFYDAEQHVRVTHISQRGFVSLCGGIYYCFSTHLGGFSSHLCVCMCDC